MKPSPLPWKDHEAQHIIYCASCSCGYVNRVMDSHAALVELLEKYSDEDVCDRTQEMATYNMTWDEIRKVECKSPDCRCCKARAALAIAEKP